MQEILLLLRSWYSDLGKKVSDSLCWGYKYSLSTDDKRLREYLEAVNILRNQELDGHVCICPEEVQKIIDGTKKHLGPSCTDLVYDFVHDQTRREEWERKNPFCVAYKTWPEHLAALCSRVGINIQVHKSRCEQLQFNPVVTEKLLCDKIDILLKVEEAKNCGVDLSLSVEERQKCLIDIETNVLPFVCDVDLETIVTAYSCGVSLDTVVEAFQCASLGNPKVVEYECVEEAVGDFDEFFLLATAVPSPACYYSDVVFEVAQESQLANLTFVWSFGEGASIESAIGPGPHSVQWTTPGVKTPTVRVYSKDVLVSEDEITVTIQNCPGSIVGDLHDTVGNPLASYNFRLYEDFDDDGIADGAAVRSVSTTSGGAWSMASLIPGNYILEANFVLDDDVVFTDLNTVGASYDGVLDLLTPVAGVTDPSNKAVKIPVRPLKINGRIDVILDLT